VWQWRSSAKHAAIAPRYLGLRAVIGKSFARIHWQNLANYGVLALEFENPGDYDTIDQGDTLAFNNFVTPLRTRTPCRLKISPRSRPSLCAKGFHHDRCRMC
jgi:aconitate hydratase